MPRPASLSLDLLHTFLLLLKNEGDAAETARQLGINQPSMSKRLRYLQLTSPVLDRPWLARDGKTWKLTPEGERVLPAVRDLISRYEQLSAFNAQVEAVRPDLRFACGRQAALSLVRRAVREFYVTHPKVRLRISTLRGAARIEGVANGSLDLATVTHDATSIREVARRDLWIETISRDRLALVCHASSPWAADVERLPKTKASPTALQDFPLILPEADSGIRRELDALLRKQELLGRLDIRLEVGGWAAILAYVEDGHGVGVLAESALPAALSLPGAAPADAGGSLIVRYFDPAIIAPTETRIICRPKFADSDELDLSPEGRSFLECLKASARGS